MSKLWPILGSCLAILISIAAATFSGLQWHDAHNQIIYTLKPSVDFDTESDPDEPPIGIVIMNNGPGPAIVKSLTFYVDRKPYKNWGDVAQEIKLSDDQLHYYELEENDTLAVGSRYWLIGEKKRGNKDQEELNRFADFLEQHVAVEVKYCSLYGKCWSKCSTPNFCS